MDSGFTPYISVKAYPHLDLPREYVKNDEIVFNISANAAQNLVIANDQISFMARFDGVSRKIEIPISAVQGIFAKEVNQGMAFSADNENKDKENTKNSELESIESSNQSAIEVKKIKKASKPTLRIVK